MSHGSCRGRGIFVILHDRVEIVSISAATVATLACLSLLAP